MPEESCFKIPPLVDGGMMLSWRCTNRCRHCLYRCSPDKPDEWLTLNTAETIFTALLNEPDLCSIHLSGGEATLKMDLLLDVIRMATEMGAPLSYLETNAFWCKDAERGENTFLRLREAGLPGVLVSASMFHNEFVPFQRTRSAVASEIRVFGADNVIVWLPNLYHAISCMGGEDRRRPLEEFVKETGLHDRMQALPGLYQLIPAGRVVEALRECYTQRSADFFQNSSCLRDLTDTRHFHTDPDGNIFTGLCAGIVACNAEDPHPEIREDNKPVFYTLCKGGPYALMFLAKEGHGYVEKTEGYVSKCDLCQDVRKHLWTRGGFSELNPRHFYED